MFYVFIHTLDFIHLVLEKSSISINSAQQKTSHAQLAFWPNPIFFFFFFHLAKVRSHENKGIRVIGVNLEIQAQLLLKYK